MALAEVIRFMKLDNELTDKEFYGSFCKSIGRELIVSSLYQQFKNNLDATKKATSIQSKIMNKRKKIQKEASSYECIDKLPSELISECGSFLDYKDYFGFGHCNRSIYYSLYSPSKIQKIDTSDILNCDNLAAFKNVKNLSIDIGDFVQLTPANKAIWANNESLRKLTIWAESDEDTEKFMHDVALINNVNVKELDIGGYLSKELFFKILSRFDGIERLTLGLDCTFELDDNQADDSWAIPFRNLTQLKRFYFGDVQNVGPTVPNLILDAVCDKVESLTFNSASDRTELLFPKLTKLIAWWYYEDASPYDHVNSLKEIEFQILDNVKWSVVSPMFRVIVNQKALETLVLTFLIETDHDYSTPSGILKQIEAAFLKHAVGCGLNQRLSIKLDLCYYDPQDIKASTNKEFGLCVFRAINALSTFKPTGWKFQIELSLYKFAKSDIGQFQLNVLDTLKTKYSVQYKIEHDVLDIMIESK